MEDEGAFPPWASCIGYEQAPWLGAYRACCAVCQPGIGTKGAHLGKASLTQGISEAALQILHRRCEAAVIQVSGCLQQTLVHEPPAHSNTAALHL